MHGFGATVHVQHPGNCVLPGNKFPGISKATIYFYFLLIGFFFLRFFGQGLLIVIGNTMVGKWFVEYKFLAFTIMGSLNGIVFWTAPALINVLIEKTSWLDSWRLMSYWFIFILPVLGWAFFRNNPEDCGLLPDGKKKQVKEKKIVISGVSARSTLRTLPFWAIAWILCTQGFSSTGIYFHMGGIGVESGMTNSEAMAMFIPAMYISVPVSIFLNLSTKWISFQRLLQFMTVGQMAFFFSIFYLDTSLGYIMTIIMIGMSSGFWGPIYTQAMPHFFGRKHLGQINGILTSLLVVSSAMGPIYLATIENTFQFFKYANVSFVILPVLGFILASRMKTNDEFKESDFVK